MEIAIDRPVSRLVGGDIARLLDRQPWVCVRGGRNCRADSSDVDVARQLHGDEGGASVDGSLELGCEAERAEAALDVVDRAAGYGRTG